MKKIFYIALFVFVLGALAYLYTNGTSKQANEVEFGIVGTWQQVLDPLAVMTLNDDGTHVSSYDGKVMDTSIWAIYEGDEGIFLKIVQGSDVYDYVILDVTRNTLSMSYVPRGNTLE